MNKGVTWIMATGLLFGATMNAWAIATADNTTSADNPTNHSYSLNWDYIYKYKNSSSVAVDHYWILTASHVADDGGTGNLTIGGETYTQQEIVFHPTADLALVRFEKPFPGYYPLHDGELYTLSQGTRTYQDLIMVGFGYTGAVTSVSFSNGPGGNGIKRWGTNTGTGYEDMISSGGKDTFCFETDFNLITGTSFEGGAAQFDSGGPVFIQSSGVWKLVGIDLYLGTKVVQFDANYAAKVPNYISWIQSVITDYDTDMDGLPDWWEMQYGGGATSLDAETDLDGDGLSNYKEWLADTVPTNAGSYFSVGFYTNDTTLAFTSSTNREYRIRFRTNLMNTNESWQTEVDWFAGSYPQTVQSVSSTTSNRFYTVNARLR